MNFPQQRSTLLTPTVASERIQALDLLRGFAILGMFFVHMTGVSWNWALAEQGLSGLNLLLLYGGDFLFSTKAFSLFSLLFGFGFALQMQRAEARNSPFLPVYLRRMLGLFIIGNAIWLLGIPNDVLIIFAMFAVLLIPLRHRPSGVILLVAGFFAAVQLFADTLVSVPQYFGQLEIVAFITQEGFSDAQRAAALQVYSEGNFPAFVAHRFERWVWWWTHWRHFLYEVVIASLMMFGMYVACKGWLHDIPGHLAIFRRALRWGLGLGLPLTALGTLSYVLRDNDAITPGFWLLGNLAFFPFGSLLMVCGYASALVLASQVPNWWPKLYPLAAIGRMALTNFILTYVPYSFIVYGWGLGFWGQATPTQMFLVWLVQLPLQAAFSVWWLQRYRFGPIEWAWRCFTYGHIQPMRIQNETAAYE
jgi:uncharacterized protein